MRTVKVTSDPRSAYLDGKAKVTDLEYHLPIKSEETFNIKIVKVFFDNEFSHWEFEAGFEDLVESFGTAPRWTGVIDMAIETLESKVNWLKADANEAKN